MADAKPEGRWRGRPRKLLLKRPVFSLFAKKDLQNRGRIGVMQNPQEVAAFATWFWSGARRDGSITSRGALITEPQAALQNGLIDGRGVGVFFLINQILCLQCLGAWAELMKTSGWGLCLWRNWRCCTKLASATAVLQLEIGIWPNQVLSDPGRGRLDPLRAAVSFSRVDRFLNEKVGVSHSFGPQREPWIQSNKLWIHDANSHFLGWTRLKQADCEKKPSGQCYYCRCNFFGAGWCFCFVIYCPAARRQKGRPLQAKWEKVSVYGDLAADILEPCSSWCQAIGFWRFLLCIKTIGHFNKHVELGWMFRVGWETFLQESTTRSASGTPAAPGA